MPWSSRWASAPISVSWSFISRWCSPSCCCCPLRSLPHCSLPLLLQQPIYTSHYNRFIGNHFGENTLGATSLRQPNGIDFWWDGSGKGNCWKDNTAVDGTPSKGGDSLHPRSSDCPDGNQPDLITQLVTAYPPQILQYLPCLLYSRTDPDSKALCPFFTELSPPAGREGGARVRPGEERDCTQRVS